jgi:HD-like signal output (HDOD) protein
MPVDTLELVRRSGTIPSVPQVAARFLQIVKNPDFSYEEVVDLFRSDPAMTAEILRLANSALFGVARQISSLHQALTLLGLRRVRALVLGRYIVSAIARRVCDIDICYFWRRCLARAAVAGGLAQLKQPKLQEETFITALLADVGVILMAEALGPPYEPIGRQYRPGGAEDLVVAEKRLFGATHADVTAVVLDDWQLPELMVQAARLHHEVQIGADVEPMIAVTARLVNAADRIAKLLCEGPELPRASEVCRGAMKLAGLDAACLPAMLEQIEQEIAALAESLGLSVVPPDHLARIVGQIQREFPGSEVGAASGGLGAR